MHIDLETLNLRDLNALLKEAKKRHATLTKRAPAGTVRRLLATIAAKSGYTLDELFGGQHQVIGHAAKVARRKKTITVSARYRNPDNRRETWTGRGSMPRWMTEKTKFGRSPMDFLIPGLGKPTANQVTEIGKRRLVKQGSA